MHTTFHEQSLGWPSRNSLTSMVGHPVLYPRGLSMHTFLGPIICLWMFRTKTIILNDYRTANILLDQRSAIYSSRPDFLMSGYLAGRRNSVFLTKTTSPRFKIYRTLLHKTLNQRAIQAYKALQLAECQTLLKGLLETPDKFISHLRRQVSTMVCGWQPKTLSGMPWQ